MRVPADIQISDLSADLPAGRSNFGSYSELLPLGHNHPPSAIPWILARAYPSAPPQAAEMGSYLLTRGHPDPFRSVHDLGHVPVGCPGKSGEPGSRSSVCLPAWLGHPRSLGRTRPPVRAPAADPPTTQSRPEPDCWPVPEGYAADEAVAAMTARFPRTFGARISGFPCSSPVGEGAASGSAYGCTSPCLPAANIYRRSPSSSACNDGQWSCAPYLPARVG